jgi:hypothetical protein
MLAPSLALIVASPWPKTGKTLLARLIVDYFRGLGQRPVIFDTDTYEPKLASFFPNKAKVIDLDKVPGQMALFDRLSLPSAETRVVDLTHRHFDRFFDLMRSIDFAAEAKGHEVVPAILYIAGRDLESYERGLRLMREFPEYAFVLVENLFLGEVEPTTRVSDAYQAFQDHEPHMVMPSLEPFFAGMIDNTTLSLAEFTRERPASVATPRLPLAFLSLEARDAVRDWVNTAFSEIARVSAMLKGGREPLPYASDLAGEEGER